ncbi:MAG TPA: sulfite exporter TauE/SafE family protein [Candidatus Limnocylindria bacterium]|nr:sulfite exporter TauE/SafE family protein [Candidatus Limnocylindria bacterium]
MPTELLLFLSGLAAGAFGGLLGLGGGILIVPILTIGFGVPITAAAGVSLVSVIATSAGGAAFNVRNGRADVRIGMLLAAGTVVGALTGGVIAGILPDRVLAGLFAALMAYTAVTMGRRLLQRDGLNQRQADAAVDPSAPDGPDAPDYRTHRVGPGIGLSFVAGNVSGLLGVGGGVVVVPLMNLLLGAPLMVAAATSNFMIGMTAAAGAYAYLFRGDVDPALAAPMVIGVVIGASGQARVASRIPTTALRVAFIAVLAYVTYEMALRALGAA